MQNSAKACKLFFLKAQSEPFLKIEISSTAACDSLEFDVINEVMMLAADIKDTGRYFRCPVCDGPICAPPL